MTSASQSVDLSAVPATGDGVHWTLATPGDLNANLIVLDPGHSIQAHINDEVDVVIVVLAGGGRAVIEGVEHALHRHALLHVTRGDRRAMVAGEAGLRYVTIHRSRGPLRIKTAPGHGPG